MVQLGMDTLDDHYRVVDHNGDGENQCTEGKKVKTESDEVQCKERTDERYGNGNGRNKGGTDILQEDVYHEEHENEGLDESLDYLVNRCVEEVVGVHRYIDFDARGESSLYLVEQVGNIFDDGGSVGAGGLVYHGRYGVVSVLEVFEVCS